MHKFKRRLLGVAAAGLLLSTGFAFRQRILAAAVPKTLLSSAITAAMDQLQARFEKDPLLGILKRTNSEGIYSVQTALEAGTDSWDTLRLDAEIQLDFSRHQAAAQGTVSAGAEAPLQLDGYLDQTSIAVCVPEFTGNRFWGLQYDTFLEDVQTIPLLRLLVQEETMQEWNRMLQSLQAVVQREYSCFYRPKWMDMNWNSLPLGVLTYPCEREQRMLSVNGKPYSCQVFSYLLEGNQLKTAIPEVSCTEDAQITVSFYLYENKLLSIRLNCAEESRRRQCTLFLGENPLIDDFLLTYQDGEKAGQITLSTAAPENEYLQKIRFQEGEWKRDIHYQWTPEAGVCVIGMDDHAAEIRLQLLDDHIRVECNDFLDFAKPWKNSSVESDSSPKKLSGWFSICSGSPISPPEYTNIREWSFEDVLFWIEALGQRIGMKFF